MQTSRNDDPVPLCVDLDGTLIRSGWLVESIARLIRQDIVNCLRVLFWAMGGRSGLERHVAARTQPDPGLLPENAPFVEWLAQQRQAGRRLVLCTSAPTIVATRFAAHFACFDDVIAGGRDSGGGATTAAQLTARFGTQGYDYAGSERSDPSVWTSARRIVAVDSGEGVLRGEQTAARVERVFAGEARSWRSWARALRLHQWAKNALIFLPAAGAHRLIEPQAAFASALAFVLFGICASGTYLLNDLMDLDADRRHPTKKARPFASGSIPLLQGFAVAPALIVFAMVSAALLLGWRFFAVLSLYLVATVWYSRSLKRIAMVDVLTLAALYALRVIAGAAATGIVPSFWLLAFTMFLFLSLAMAKRYSELKLMMAGGRTHTEGRGYTVDDAALVQSCGVAAGYISVLVMALYVNSDIAREMYAAPEFLWLLCPLLLYWNTRVWLKTSRGQMHDDPVVFTLKDRPSLYVAVAGLVLIWAAGRGLASLPQPFAFS